MASASRSQASRGGRVDHRTGGRRARRTPTWQWPFGKAGQCDALNARHVLRKPRNGARCGCAPAGTRYVNRLSFQTCDAILRQGCNPSESAPRLPRPEPQPKAAAADQAARCGSTARRGRSSATALAASESAPRERPDQLHGLTRTDHTGLLKPQPLELTSIHTRHRIHPETVPQPRRSRFRPVDNQPAVHRPPARARPPSRASTVRCPADLFDRAVADARRIANLDDFRRHVTPQLIKIQCDGALPEARNAGRSGVAACG